MASAPRGLEWRRSGGKGLALYKGLIVLMTVEQRPDNKFEFYGMGYSSATSGKLYPTAADAKAAAETEAKTRLRAARSQ